jgi:hypothetical protein
VGVSIKVFGEVEREAIVLKGLFVFFVTYGEIQPV